MDANLICCVNSKYLHNILFILLLCVFHDTNTSLSLFFFSLFFYCPKKNNIKKKIVILVLVLQTTVGSGSGPASGSITAGGTAGGSTSSSNISPNVISGGSGTAATGVGCGVNDEQCLELKELVVLVNEHRVVRACGVCFLLFFPISLA